MPARRRSRIRALQILYQWELRRQLLAEDDPVEESISAYYGSLFTIETRNEEPEAPMEKDEFMEELVRGTVAHLEEIDPLAELHSSNWRLERMAAVDRNLLRLAIYEMKWAGTPPAVVIDEALELAKRFSGEDSARFLNGVLDAVRQRIA